MHNESVHIKFVHIYEPYTHLTLPQMADPAISKGLTAAMRAVSIAIIVTTSFIGK